MSSQEHQEKPDQAKDPQAIQDQEMLEQTAEVDAAMCPTESRNTTQSYDAHIKWLENASVGSESADEQLQEEDEEPIEFDDATSEISSTPLAESVTQVYLGIDETICIHLLVAMS